MPPIYRSTATQEAIPGTVSITEGTPLSRTLYRAARNGIASLDPAWLATFLHDNTTLHAANVEGTLVHVNPTDLIHHTLNPRLHAKVPLTIRHEPNPDKHTTATLLHIGEVSTDGTDRIFLVPPPPARRDHIAPPLLTDSTTLLWALDLNPKKPNKIIRAFAYLQQPAPHPHPTPLPLAAAKHIHIIYNLTAERQFFKVHYTTPSAYPNLHSSLENQVYGADPAIPLVSPRLLSLLKKHAAKPPPTSKWAAWFAACPDPSFIPYVATLKTPHKPILKDILRGIRKRGHAKNLFALNLPLDTVLAIIKATHGLSPRKLTAAVEELNHEKEPRRTAHRRTPKKS